MKFLILALTIFSTTTIADTLLVPSEYAAIRWAISAAQNGDTVLVAPGDYCGGFSFQGKNIVVRSSAGASSTFNSLDYSGWARYKQGVTHIVCFWEDCP